MHATAIMATLVVGVAADGSMSSPLATTLWPPPAGMHASVLAEPMPPGGVMNSIAPTRDSVDASSVRSARTLANIPQLSHPTLTGKCCADRTDQTFDAILPRPPHDACEFMLPSSVLLNDPQPVRGQLPPCLDLDLWTERGGRDSRGEERRPDIEFSLIVNVFNHEKTIARVLRQVLKLTNESCVLDCQLSLCFVHSFLVPRRRVAVARN